MYVTVACCFVIQSSNPCPMRPFCGTPIWLFFPYSFSFGKSHSSRMKINIQHETKFWIGSMCDVRCVLTHVNFSFFNFLLSGKNRLFVPQENGFRWKCSQSHTQTYENKLMKTYSHKSHVTMSMCGLVCVFL